MIDGEIGLDYGERPASYRCWDGAVDTVSEKVYRSFRSSSSKGHDICKPCSPLRRSMVHAKDS